MALSIGKGAEAICVAMKNALKRKEGLLIGRNGTIEMEALFFRTYGARPGQEYPDGISRRLELHAGIFPPTKGSIDRWVFALLEAVRLSDVIVAGWYAPFKDTEEVFLREMNLHGTRIPLRSLEPYYVEPEARWTNLLANRKVAIVNSFVDTAMTQIEKREEIWPLATDSLLPPTTEWIPIRTGYAPVLAKGRAGWSSTIQSWDVAVTDTVKRVIESGADIAIIGCGGLGMVIGAELRKRNKVAIILGGATQVLFGIKGNRWEHHDVISHFWNEAWVYPQEQETPNGANQIEQGCYWGKN